MTNKSYAIIGISATFLFWTTYIIMSYIRPEYNLFHKAVSELGSLDAPNKWIWNVLGYITTGVLITVYSYGLFKSIFNGQASKLPLIGFVLSGLFMSLSGFFPGDFDNKHSVTMLLHSVGSFGSYLFFLIGSFTYPRHMSKSEYWKNSVKPTLLFTWLTIIFGSWPFFFASYPAVGQRIVFLFYFLWIFFTAIKLYKQPNTI